MPRPPQAPAPAALADHLENLRHLLLAAFLLTAAGIAAELLLLGHTEDPWQWAPLALVGASGAALAALLLVPRPILLRCFQAMMVAQLASAAVGLYLHGEGNLEFERELARDLTGWALFWKSLHGVSPPSLAPGAMALLGMLGLGWAHRHPVIERPTHEPTLGDNP